MRQRSTKLNLIVLALLAFTSKANALPRAVADFNMVRLLQIQAGDVLLASISTPMEFLNRDLQVRFRKSLSIPSQHPVSLGASCALRSLQTNEAIQNSTLTAISNSSGQRIAAGTELHLQNINVDSQSFRAVLADQKSRRGRLELTCNHPKIHDWSVTSFEIHTQGLFEIRSNIQRDPAAEIHSKPLEIGVALKTLQGHPWNGYFGSGLPGTAGIQLLIGSNPRAFSNNGNEALWVGSKCRLLGEESSLDSVEYKKDSKFAYVGRSIDTAKGKVQFHFQNWAYSLEHITIECGGYPHEVLSMTTAQVENDLNGAIHFYNK